MTFLKFKHINRTPILCFLFFICSEANSFSQVKSDTVLFSDQTAKPSVLHTMVGYLDSLDGLRETIVNKAFPFVGTPYKYASSGPSSFDCSGFTQFLFAYVDMILPHNAFLQSQLGNIVKLTEAIKGDLMFFGYKSKDGSNHISHVGMVYSNRNGVVEMIHASTSEGVRIDRTDSNNWTNYWSKKFIFAKRLVD